MYVNERQKIGHYRARSTEERRRMPNRYFLLRAVRIYVNCAIIALLYTHSFGNQP